MNAPASYPIESVDNAATILLMLRAGSGVRVGQVATELSVARSTAHRLLTTLQARGLLRQNPATKVYKHGPALVELGLAVMASADLRLDARPLLESIAEHTGETTHLLILEGTETVFIDGVEGRHVIRSALRIGHRGPAQASAAGKVLLADLSPEELARRFPANRISGGTTSAVQSRQALRTALERTREDGYGVNDGESEPDLYAVSVGLRDRGGALHGAISVSGPRGRGSLQAATLGPWLVELVAARAT